MRFVCLIAALLAPAIAYASDAELEALEEKAYQEAAAIVGPSIVRIQTVGGVDRVGELLTGTAPTTGLVVGADGYVITSSFNFVAKPSSILVELPDGRRFPATVVAADESRMLTLLKIEAEDLTPAEAAPKSEIRVGQWAVALGRTYDNPLPSISVGIVSAVNRIWDRAIQTDAKVSPVNYGGPLADTQGRVLGVLVPLSPESSEQTSGVEWYDSGIGFAVPLEDVYAVLERLKGGETLKPGRVGIELKPSLVLGSAAVIDRVRVESPADKAGLKPGDEILEVAGKKVDREGEVLQALGPLYAGEKLAMVVRRGNESVRTELTLAAELVPYQAGFLGILPARESASETSEPGLPVRYVFPKSPAARAGLQPSDRILRFGDSEVPDRATLMDLVSRARPEERASVTFVRDGNEQTVDVKLSEIPDEIPADVSPAAIPAGEAAEDGPERGRITVELPGEESHRYAAYVPPDFHPDYKYGLVVWLHPFADTKEAEVFERWKSVCEQRGVMLIAPKAPEETGWTMNDAEFVKAAVEDFMSKYPIDRERVFVHGLGSSGPLSYHLAFTQRDLFHGVAAVAAFFSEVPPENRPGQRLQFLMMAGSADPAAQVLPLLAKVLRGMAYPVTVIETETPVGEYPDADAVEAIGRWADCLDRI